MIKITKATKQDLEQLSQLFNEYDQETEKYFPKNHLRLLQKLNTEHGNNLERRKNI